MSSVLPLRRSPVLFAALGTAILVLAHCGSQTDRCNSHDDCGSGEYCVASTGACEERRGGGGSASEGDACQTRTDCIEGLVCTGGTCAYPTADGCETSADCPRGTRCDAANQCVTGCATAADCASDEACDPSLARCVHCSLAGTCDGTDGGDQNDGGTDGGTDDGGTDGGDDGGTPDCSTKYDCAEGEVCQGGTCRTPTTTTCTTSATCGRGRICHFTGKCEPGCEENRDCSGGKLCHPTRQMCEACSPQNPCGAGEICVEEACVEAPTCSSSADCVSQYDGSICRDGFCTNCAGHASCNTAPYSSAQPPKNFCSAEGFCVGDTCSDEQCQQQHGDRWYCDQPTGMCREFECVEDSDCPHADYACIDNVCNSCHGQTLTDCHADCAAQGTTCNPGTCLCDGGGSGGPCTVDSDCSGGLTCVAEIPIVGGTTACSTIPFPGIVECYCGSGGGGGFPGGGGASCSSNADCTPPQTCQELIPGSGMGTCG